VLTSVLAFLSKLLHPVLHLFGVDVAPFFDPDMNVWSLDKFEHFVGVGALTWGFSVFFPNVTAAIIAIICAAIFELGQWDALRTAAPSKIGEPGYGFGVLDLAFGAAGAVATVIALAFV